MSIEYLEQKYQELGQSYKELGAEIEALKASKVLKKFPQSGDAHWYVNGMGDVEEGCWRGALWEETLLVVGATFPTRREAEAHLNTLIVIEELRRCEGYRPFITREDNYGMFLTLSSNQLHLNIWRNDDSSWQGLYFDSKKSIEDAIKKVGAARIISAIRWISLREVPTIG